MRPLAFAFLVLGIAGPAFAEAWKGEPGDVPALERAAGAGDAEAMAELAYHSLFSLGGVAYDENRIFDLAKRSAERGSALGMACLAVCHVDGIGTDFDSEAAYGWAEKSAALEHAEGLRLLGHCYLQGYHVAKDWERGLKLYREAEKLGSAPVRSVLGNMYWKDKEQKNKKEGLRRLAAVSDELDWRNATADLVNILESNNLQEEEPDLHARMLARLENDLASGHPRSLYVYGHHLRLLGDKDGCLHYLGEAARLGDRSAMGNLVSYMLEFEGVSTEFELRCDNKAIARLGRIAYEKGSRNHAAMAGAARSLISGDGLRPVDLAKAETLATELVQDGHCSSYVDLSYITVRAYETGVGPMQKHELAVACALFHSHHQRSSAELLARLLAGDHDGKLCPGDLFKLPEAYAAARYAAEKGSPFWGREQRLEKLKGRLSPEELEASEKLTSEGYPKADKFREPAAAVLEKAGILKTEANPFRPKKDAERPPADGGV